MKTICGLARIFSNIVANLLDRENKLKRGHFREETFTDIFSGSLAAFAGPQLVIQYPPEASTGGDIDLDFWHIKNGQNIYLRIQSKRLNAEINNGKAVRIDHRSYNKILYRVPEKTGPYQFNTLANDCGYRLPLYMFYNHGAVTRHPYFKAKLPMVSGVNLAFAFDIEREMIAKVEARPKRLPHTRLAHLRQYLFGLNTILCPPGNWEGKVPSPLAVSASLDRAWTNIMAEQGNTARLMRAILKPETISPYYNSDRRLSDGPAIRVNRTLDRPTITFISGRTEDSRTPRIFDDSDTSD